MNKVVTKQHAKIAILALGPDGEFGNTDPNKKGLPFKSKTDLKWFNKATIGETVVMSKKTFELIPNGLPDRTIYFASRKGIESHNGYLDLNRYPADILIAGGKQVYREYMDKCDFAFISFIPEHLTQPADVKFKLQEWFDANYHPVFMGQTNYEGEDNIAFVVLSRAIKITEQHVEIMRLNEKWKHRIASTFEPYLKLRIKENVIIQPQSHGEVEISTLVCVPIQQTGIFSIRQSLAGKGLYTSGTNFKQNWAGNPRIIVTNKSLNPIELKAGEEIGEISFLLNGLQA